MVPLLGEPALLGEPEPVLNRFITGCTGSDSPKPVQNWFRAGSAQVQLGVQPNNPKTTSGDPVDHKS